MNFRVGAQIDKQGLSVTLWINRIRIYRNADPEQRSGGEFFTEWLVPGENHARYLVEAAGTEADGRSLHLAFFRQDDDAMEPSSLHTVSLQTLPIDGEFSFAIDDLPAAPPWSGSAATELDGPARSAIMDEVESILQAAASGDGAAIAGKMRYSLTLAAPFYDMDDPEEAIQGMSQALGFLLPKAAALPTFAASDYALEPMDDGRLILAMRQDGGPILSVFNPDMPAMRIEIARLFFARLDGLWTIVHT